MQIRKAILASVIFVTYHIASFAHSPFAVLDEDGHQEAREDIVISSDAVLEEFSYAKFNVLDYDHGEKFVLEIKKGESSYINKESRVVLRSCVTQKDDLFHTLSIASISVYNEKNKEFDYTIYSYYPSLSLPKIGNKFLYLSSCLEKDDEK